MITFESSIDHPVVTEALVLVRSLLDRADFYAKIAAHDRFDYANATPAQIAALLRESNAAVTIVGYSPRRRSKVLAYEDARYPGTVFLNVRRLDRSPESVAATIVHECVHAVDSQHATLDFGHGKNGARGKENTAPYFIDAIAYEMLATKPSRASTDERFASIEDDLRSSHDDSEVA